LVNDLGATPAVLVQAKQVDCVSSDFSMQIRREAMNLQKIASTVVLGIVALAFSSATLAETVKIEGVIVGGSGDEIVVQFGSGAELALQLTDNTEVSQTGGLFNTRNKQMAMAALIPGLNVKAEGVYNEHRQVLATSIKFKGNDLKDAQKIQAGMREVKVQNEQQQEELDRKSAELKAQKEALEKQQAQLIEQQKQVEANKAAIAANTARFGQLDDYYIWDEVTVLFGNGKVKVGSQYEPQLLALAEKAKTVDGYVIEVKGYASSAGNASINQKLSEDRAGNVTNILLQKGHIPLTRMLAPGAMGETHQVGNDKTAEGQAENRRVVVRVLQNKAIAGI
jgi:outer membrane protein OmpA-like peptidoglycan-associated protein